MENNFKYLTHNPEDKRWGLYLMVAGSAKIEPHTSYPPKGHPTGNNFQWTNGRILQEYQINYITEGEGVMETRKARYNIKAGSIILLHPNLWHRYKPVRKKDGSNITSDSGVKWRKTLLNPRIFSGI